MTWEVWLGPVSMCVHICVHISMYYVYMCDCVYVLHLNMYMYACVYMYACKYNCVYLCASMYVHVCLYMYAWVYVLCCMLEAPSKTVERPVAACDPVELLYVG